MKGDAMNSDARLESLAKRLGTEAAARLDVEATARKVEPGRSRNEAGPSSVSTSTWVSPSRR